VNSEKRCGIFVVAFSFGDSLKYGFRVLLKAAIVNSLGWFFTYLNRSKIR
jgi:hypothetical protein